MIHHRLRKSALKLKLSFFINYKYSLFGIGHASILDDPKPLETSFILVPVHRTSNPTRVVGKIHLCIPEHWKGATLLKLHRTQPDSIALSADSGVSKLALPGGWTRVLQRSYHPLPMATTRLQPLRAEEHPGSGMPNLACEAKMRRSAAHGRGWPHPGEPDAPGMRRGHPSCGTGRSL